MWRHPKYYKELRKLRNRVVQSSRTDSPQSDQAISNNDGLAQPVSVRPGPGLKPQATSSKLQAPSLESSKQQAPSGKPGVPSSKPEATSSLILDPGNKK